MRRTIRAHGTAVTLALNGDELCTLMADNIHLVEGLFQVLANRAAEAERLVLKGAAGDDLSLLAKLMTEESALAGERLLSKGARGEEITRLAAGGLTPVQRVLVLGRIPLFSRVSAEEMLHLASIVREVPLTTGQTLIEESDPPALCVILAGELSLDAPRRQHADGRPRRRDPGGCRRGLRNAGRCVDRPPGDCRQRRRRAAHQPRRPLRPARAPPGAAAAVLRRAVRRLS